MQLTRGGAVVREEHRTITVALPASGIALGSSRIVTVTLDSAREVELGVMPFDCQDTHFWAADRFTELSYWLKPFTCNTTTTAFFVKLPGSAETADSGSVDIFVSFGGGHRLVPPVTAAAMDGAETFAFSDGYTTVASGPQPAGAAEVRYPTDQQLASHFRYRFDGGFANFGVRYGDGIGRHQYRGNWSHLVMAHTKRVFQPHLRVEQGWDATHGALVPGATYVTYLSPHDATVYAPYDFGGYEEGGPSGGYNHSDRQRQWIGEDTLFATFTMPQPPYTTAAELRVWGSDGAGRQFARAVSCNLSAVPAYADALHAAFVQPFRSESGSESGGGGGGDSNATANATAAADDDNDNEDSSKWWGDYVEGAESTLQLGLDLDDPSASFFSLRLKLGRGVGWLACPTAVEGFAGGDKSGRLWGLSKGADTWAIINDGNENRANTTAAARVLPQAMVTEAADVAAGYGGWEFEALPPLKVYTGVDQSLRAPVNNSFSDFFFNWQETGVTETFDWAGAHAYMIVQDTSGAAGGDGGGDGDDSASAEELEPLISILDTDTTTWRIRFTSEKRSAKEMAYELRLSLNGQGGEGVGRGALLQQYTDYPVATGFSYRTPANLTVFPDLLDLTYFDRSGVGLADLLLPPATEPGSDAASSFNLTITSADVAAAIAAVNDSTFVASWLDLPLNAEEGRPGVTYDDAGSAGGGISALRRAANVSVALRVGRFSGAPCVSGSDAASGGNDGATLVCSLDGIKARDILAASYDGAELLALSFNGGASYSPVRSSLTAYALSANFSTALVGSANGGTTIAGNIALATTGKVSKLFRS